MCATTVNYPTPVVVNGYSCKNCTDVDLAKKHVDPAHPKDGPYGINAKDQPGAADKKSPDKTPQADAQSPAVTFGGALAGLNAGSASSVQPQQQAPAVAQGQRLNVLA